MRLVHQSQFNRYSGELTYCFEEPTDGTQNLVDWASAFSSAYTIANIPENRWVDFVLQHLSGPAAQEARTIRRDNPAITWRGIVDTFAVKFSLVDEQIQLRAKMLALRPAQFPTLAKFVARFTHLVSYDDKILMPLPLLADILVLAMTGSPVAPFFTQLHLQHNGQTSFTILLNSLTVLSQTLPPPIVPPPSMLIAGYANQPAPASLPPSPVRRPFPAGIPCRFCQGTHSDRLCPSPAGIAVRKSLTPPRRPCRYCQGTHWDVDCKDMFSQKPRPGGIPLPSPQKTSARVALFTQGPPPKW